MRLAKITFLFAAVVLTSALSELRGSVDSADPMGPLRVHPKNRRYFQNAATGELVYLTGSHTWANLVDMGPSDPPKAFDFGACLDWMESLNHNFIRLWTWELVAWDTSANGENKVHTCAPMPWARTGPGKALDGKQKFDLKKFNPEYFERLHNRVAASRQRGIYVSVMLFEGWGLQFAKGAWQGHPFNPKNNINGIDGDANKDGKGVEVHTLGNKAVTAVQEQYVRKVIDTVNGFDNVLYEISNENHPASTQWQYHMIRYIRNYEKNKAMHHPVGMTYQHQGGSNKTLFDSPADWISPNNQGNYRDNPPRADGLKVVLSDTDHLWGIGGNQAWVWKSFTRGINPIFMDPYDGVVLGSRFDKKWAPIQRSMGFARRYAQKIDMVNMLPRPDLASTKFCLANPGKEYLVYNPSADQDTFTVQFKAGAQAVGKYKFEWLNPDIGKVVLTGTLDVKKGPHTFKAPFKGDAVLYIVKQ